MSKNKVIVLAVLEAGLSQSDAARRYGVSRRWVHELLRRYARDGEAGSQALPRCPRSSPHRTDEAVRTCILALRGEFGAAGLDTGGATIAWHLDREGLRALSVSTIWRILKQAGLVIAEPWKRPRSSLRRFAAAQPNETWQSDFTHWPLAAGTDTEILNFLDDHSLYLLFCTAHARVTGPLVVQGFLASIEAHGVPASTLTDNGMVYTTRFSGGKGGRNAFEHTLAALGIHQKNGSPSHPQTQGKIERFHQTLKKWLDRQPRAHTLAELNDQLRKFRHVYNHERPHRALNRRTPAAAYAATPKAAPAAGHHRPHFRVRTDRIDTTGKVSLRFAGRLRHLGIGRAHAGTAVLILTAETDAVVVNQDTGEILAEFILDPTKDYQGKKKHPGPKTGV
jgi:transposase InsO family protein